LFIVFTALVSWCRISGLSWWGDAAKKARLKGLYDDKRLRIEPDFTQVVSVSQAKTPGAKEGFTTSVHPPGHGDLADVMATVVNIVASHVPLVASA
jgi:hypothetical protein